MNAEADRDGRREVRGWMLYAWAFHSFETSVATVLFGPYLTDLAQAAVGENGPIFGIALLRTVTAKSYFFQCLSISVVLQVLFLPLLGGVADYTNLKKRLMAASCYMGAGATCLLYFVGAGIDFRWGGALFALANLAFGCSVVLYNAFLPEIASPDRRDAVSSRGYALGYLGGALLLTVHLLLLRHAASLGLSTVTAVRLALLSSGFWWGGFATLTLRRLRTRAAARPLPERSSFLGLALSQLRASFRSLAGRAQTKRFLLAYLLFNDGIQTVISVAAVFLAQELFVARGLPEDQSFLLGVMLMVQFVGFLGSLVFERVAAAIGAKNALVMALLVWSGVIVYGWGFLDTTGEARAMAFTIAVVLGGSQALARSIFSRMIPPGREASFFAIFEISASGTSWLGPLIFAEVVAVTNSYRHALLSLIILFAAGTLLLVLTDTERAMREALLEAGPAPGGARQRRGLLRRGLDGLGWRLVRIAAHVFFRDVDVRGLERLPPETPLVVVANHNNSVLDAVLLLGVPGLRARVLAKSPLFSHPILGPLLALVGALPVYRRQDAGAKVARNGETFARCHGALASGDSIALFPEGTSHDGPRRLPLKTGAARIVLEAESRRGLLGVRVVPIFLDYDAKERFRSRARVWIGRPMDPSGEAVRYAEEPGAAVRALTERIGAGLDQARGDEPWPAPTTVLRRRVVPLVLGAPLCVVGYVLNWFPYRVPGWVAGRLSTSADDQATYKLVTALLSFPVAWICETAAAAQLGGVRLGLAMALLAPLSGYAALRLSPRFS